MTQGIAVPLVKAQDDSQALWPEHASATDVIGLGRAALNAQGLGLLPQGAARDTTGLWTRAWSVLGPAGPVWTWSVQSTDSDSTLALARAYRDVLGMPVRLDGDDAPASTAPPAATTWRSGKNTGPGTSGKRPPWARIERTPGDPAADLERMRAEAPWAGETTGQTDGASLAAAEPPSEPVHAEGVLPSAPTRAEGPVGCEADGASSPAPDTLPDTASPLASTDVTAPEKPAGKTRHRWLGGDACVRCGQSKGAASGECQGRPAQAEAASDAVVVGLDVSTDPTGGDW